MEQITIRKASLGDLDVLLRFEQGVIDAERPFDNTIKADPIHYYDIKEMISSPDVEIVVAESGREIIGSGYARIKKSKPYLKNEQYAYLGFMYVVPDHRGKGVIGKIIETLKEWAISQNITEIKLDVYSDNLGAIKAYEKSGFARHMVTMRMGLNDD